MVYLLKHLKVYNFNSNEQASYFLLRFFLKTHKLIKYNINIALAGGNTPLYLYSIMSKYNFSKFNFFLTDERYVENTHKDSNYKNISKFLNINPIYKTGDIKKDCEEFSNTISKNPINIAILGIGEDGHSASIFPNKPIEYRTQNAIITKTDPYMRISLSEHAISNICQIIFFVSKSKELIINRFLTKQDTIANKLIKTYHKKPILVCDGLDNILKDLV